MEENIVAELKAAVFAAEVRGDSVAVVLACESLSLRLIDGDEQAELLPMWRKGGAHLRLSRCNRGRRLLPFTAAAPKRQGPSRH